jgi:hypothetical protein
VRICANAPFFSGKRERELFGIFSVNAVVKCVLPGRRGDELEALEATRLSSRLRKTSAPSQRVATASLIDPAFFDHTDLLICGNIDEVLCEWPGNSE